MTVIIHTITQSESMNRSALYVTPTCPSGLLAICGPIVTPYAMRKIHICIKNTEIKISPYFCTFRMLSVYFY